MAKRTPVALTDDGTPLLCCTIPPLPDVSFPYSARFGGPCYVYCIRRRDTAEIKIGIAIDPIQRAREIQKCHGGALELVLAVPGSSAMESDVFARFARLRKRGEWFRESPEILAWIDHMGSATPPLPDIAPLFQTSLAPRCNVVIAEAYRCQNKARMLDLSFGQSRWLCGSHCNGPEVEQTMTLQAFLLAGNALTST